MSSIQEHVDAFLALLRTVSGLAVHDGEVPDGSPDHYVLVRPFRQLPSGLVAPDKIPFTGRSAVVDMRFYCYSVGATAEASRSVAGFVEDAVLDKTPVIAGRTVWPIRWMDGSPSTSDEETLRGVHEQVDIYQLESKG